jgi:tetratricopeptide (TPR) repeat protein
MMTHYLPFLVCAVLLAQGTPLDSAWDLLAKGERQEAERVARRIIESNPRDGEARLFLGSILAEDGRASDATLQLREAVRLMPRSAVAHNALGEAFNLAGDLKSARGEFEQATALDPRFAEAHANLALVLLPAGESEAAASHLDRAIAIFGNSPDAAHPHYLRAKIYTERDETEKAQAELKQAVALRPDFPEAWSDLGQAKKTLLDDDGAFAAFQRAVELDPENAVSQYRLGAEYLRRGEARQAVGHLRESYRLAPLNQSTLNSLQLALRQDGQVEEAAQIRAKLAGLLRKIDKESQDAFNALRLNNEGAALEKSGNARAALDKYRQAVALDPAHAGFHLNFGVALLKLGEWKEGLAELREAARQDPNSAMIKSALYDALEQAPAAFGGNGKAVPRR